MKIKNKAKEREILNLLVSGTPEERMLVGELNPYYFAVYYFNHLFHHPFAPFHDDFYDDYHRMMEGELTDAMWCAHRDSAKTTHAKICVTHCICYRKRNFIRWRSEDITNAERALLNITRWLQTNGKIIADFGQLYNEPPNSQRKTRKTMREFITTNDVTVKAVSIYESARGEVSDDARPGFEINDDFETNNTVRSAAKTSQIISNMDEAKGGLAVDGASLYLCNYLSESAAVGHQMQRIEKSSKGVVRNIPVINDKGTISWPGKFVKTNEEAQKINQKREDRSTWVVSLEAKKAELDNYDAEMLNKPATSTNVFFDRDKIEEAIKKAKEPKDTIAGFKVWVDGFVPNHRYAIGGDTSEGIGLDANASVAFDFKHKPGIAAVVGTYANNQIAPDVFAHELKRQGNFFGQCLVCPERNNTGFATLTELKKIYPNIWIAYSTGNVQDRPTQKLGWQMTANNKYNAFYSFKRAFEEGEVLIWDIELLKEMKYYSMMDLTDTTIGLVTRHFDLLTAAVIGWQMREYAFEIRDPYDLYQEGMDDDEEWLKSQPV
jgi:hypothetical protein